MKTALAATLLLAACTRSGGARAPDDVDTCPKGGWESALAVDAKYESGFEPTIAWDPVASKVVLFDVAQESNDHPTHWLRVVEGAGTRWTEPRTLEDGVSGVMAAAVDDKGV